uniref:Uncharacterized protein n=1 Tax=Bicosoecida sp. CB-2014 TaxID=1486930 RepID=A0A7S1CPI1_9STRA
MYAVVVLAGCGARELHPDSEAAAQRHCPEWAASWAGRLSVQIASYAPGPVASLLEWGMGEDLSDGVGEVMGDVSDAVSDAMRTATAVNDEGADDVVAAPDPEPASREPNAPIPRPSAQLEVDAPRSDIVVDTARVAAPDDQEDELEEAVAAEATAGDVEDTPPPAQPVANEAAAAEAVVGAGTKEADEVGDNDDVVAQDSVAPSDEDVIDAVDSIEIEHTEREAEADPAEIVDGDDNGKAVDDHADEAKSSSEPSPLAPAPAEVLDEGNDSSVSGDAGGDTAAAAPTLLARLSRVRWEVYALIAVAAVYGGQQGALYWKKAAAAAQSAATGQPGAKKPDGGAVAAAGAGVDGDAATVAAATGEAGTVGAAAGSSGATAGNTNGAAAATNGSGAPGVAAGGAGATNCTPPRRDDGHDNAAFAAVCEMMRATKTSAGLTGVMASIEAQRRGGLLTDVQCAILRAQARQLAANLGAGDIDESAFAGADTAAISPLLHESSETSPGPSASQVGPAGLNVSGAHASMFGSPFSVSLLQQLAMASPGGPAFGRGGGSVADDASSVGAGDYSMMSAQTAPGGLLDATRHMQARRKREAKRRRQAKRALRSLAEQIRREAGVIGDDDYVCKAVDRSIDAIGATLRDLRTVHEV